MTFGVSLRLWPNILATEVWNTMSVRKYLNNTSSHRGGFHLVHLYILLLLTSPLYVLFVQLRLPGPGL